jgi:hypothetical protein
MIEWGTMALPSAGPASMSQSQTPHEFVPAHPDLLPVPTRADETVVPDPTQEACLTVDIQLDKIEGQIIGLKPSCDFVEVHTDPASAPEEVARHSRILGTTRSSTRSPAAAWGWCTAHGR